MFMTLQLADNLPHVTTKKKERQAAARAKQIVGTGKHKRSSNKSKPAPAKRHRAEPSPDVVPTNSSVDCQQGDNVFACRKKKAAVSSLLAPIPDLNSRYVSRNPAQCIRKMSKKLTKLNMLIS
jgi:hypothetical protein